MITRRRMFIRRLVIVLLTPLLVACGSVSIDPPTATGLSASQQAQRGQTVLRAFVKALNDRDEAAYDAVIDERFAATLEPVLDNADLLRVGTVQAEYVDSVPGGLSDDERSTYGRDAWLATARLRYRLGPDGSASSHETALVITPEDDGARIAAIGGHQARSPLWLTGPVSVQEKDGLTVINAGNRATSHFMALGRRAIRDVQATFPDWRGPLIIEVPRDKRGLDNELGVDAETYANIAAVTTTADGSVVPGAPVHVYLNPEVFDTLKSRGAQVVVSHEAAHVATDASFATMPIWLLEGFADYVALKPSGVPVSRAAAQVIKRMKKDGLPKTLPKPEELQPTAEGLGATYEEAWLACRFIGQRFGEQRLIRFYRAVSGGEKTTAAFPQVLGVSEKTFVEMWRAELDQLVNGRMAG